MVSVGLGRAVGLEVRPCSLSEGRLAAERAERPQAAVLSEGREGKTGLRRERVVDDAAAATLCMRR